MRSKSESVSKMHSPSVILFAKVRPGCTNDGEGSLQMDPVNQICERVWVLVVDVDEMERKQR